MGEGIGYSCRCGKGFLKSGFGRLGYLTIKELKENIETGKYGDSWKETLQKNPNAVFDISYEVYKCGKCGCWENEPVGNMYLKKEGNSDPLEPYYEWAFESYTCLKRKAHMCKECHGRMRRVNPVKENLICPKCKEEIAVNADELIMWD